MERRQVSTPKTFFVKERDQFYSEWTLSFWREFFQNSTDANAKSIKIGIDEVPGRGSFDEIGDHGRKMTRVVFEDDGCGMTQEVLDKVYFAIGQTTKDDGSSVGGYGRARLMTCFSQARYSILTTDRFVMGDGPNYVNYNLDEAVQALTLAIESLPEADGDVSEASRAESLKALEEDLAMVREAKAAGGFKGCRVEVDLEHVQSSRWQPLPTIAVMGKKLREYLSESQIPCSVTVNGNSPEEYFDHRDGKLQARRGAVKRTLSAEIDGETIEFATIHTSEGAKAGHKKKLIVRVDGASMFTSDIEPDVQIILEIKKDLSRAVLNSNRDGLKSEFRRVVDAFVAEVNVDKISALADKKSKQNYTIRGDKGVLIAEPPSLRQIAVTETDTEETQQAAAIVEGKPQTKQWTLAGLRARGLHEDVIEELVKTTYYGDSFVSRMRWEYDFPLAEDVRAFTDAVDGKFNRDGAKAVELFLDHASDNLKEWVVRTLTGRTAKAHAETEKKHVERLKDMNDVHVSIISANEKTRAAIRRNDPRKWDADAGKGRVPRALLSAWTAACSVAVETLLKLRPATPQFAWTTGWVYSVPEETHQGDRYRSVSVQALFQEEGGLNRFLLNPVNDDGTLRYSVSDSRDRQRLQGLAMHEVAHVLENYHNETYAGILTDMIMEYDITAANRRMKDAVRAVMAAYESGKARVQAMDAGTGARPSERLMVYASANNREHAEEAVERHEDGTWSVNSDRLQDNVQTYRHVGYEDDSPDMAIAASAR